MYRWRSGASSPTCYIALAVCTLIATVSAGPLGPLPNVTSSELGLSEGSCAVGDVVYMPGDEFPGSSPCEKCSCSDGGVHCSKQRCEPRPGCKALHRPDHCCPTYQCECEQEGRVYGNGEKLVDPADPCRVCYCQGGEVVCRRIACFVRDDCRPRLVPGRCCPEYDNCPLRGVTSIPGVAPSMSTLSTTEDTPPTEPKENIKQEITIKEITPVSEIPIITEVKIKEILPSPSIEVAEYSSSKSPPIPREVTSEKSATNKIESTERPVVIEIHKSSAAVLSSSSPPETTASSESLSVSKNDDSTPSKFSFSTQDSINSEIYPSNVPSVPIMESSETPEVPVLAVSKAPVMIEEEDAPFDHNPAFPPLPDDLSELGNHEDENIPEQNMYNEHVPSGHDVISMTTVTTSSEAPILSETSTKDISSLTVKEIETTTTTTTEKVPEISDKISSTPQETIIITSTEIPATKENLMLNLRSAIPTEILNAPSLVPEEITGELDEIESTVTTQSTSVASTINNYKTSTVTKEPVFSDENTFQSTVDTATTITPHFETTTNKAVETTELIENPKVIQDQDQTTSSIAKSNIPTEVTSQTEFSSLPVETSDQNPHEAPDNIVKDKSDTPTLGSSIIEAEPTKTFAVEPEVNTVSKTRSASTESVSTENVETTEFVLTPLGSSESATDAVELIQISPDADKSAAIIEPAAERKKNSVLTELINLVGDVASISDHTDGPNDARHVTGSTSISDSEELIPVNAGYKSKNSNYNLNFITEITPKSKNQIAGNKQKVIEIEDEDDGDSITDAPPPNDKIEPTTRRPIIDNVSDDMAGNKTDKTDIEIIKQTYVPNVERRPTKVVMKKNEKSVSAEAQEEHKPKPQKETNLISLSAETATETEISVSSETATSAPSDISSEAGERISELPKSTPSTSVQ